MKIGLIDIDSKLPNLALMKISAYYKNLGCEVEFVDSGKTYDKIFASSIFTSSKDKCDMLKDMYGDTIDIGGTGYDLYKMLPHDIELTKPDYDLYTVEDIYDRIKGYRKKENRLKRATEIVNAGMGFSCYDKETEILTKDGWKSFDDLNIDDYVATLNPDNKELEYHKPSKLIKEKYKGELIKFKNKYVDLLVTPNHKMYIKYIRKNSDYELIEASELVDRYKFNFMKTAIWKGNEIDKFKLPEVESRNSCHKEFEYDMDTWIEFLGYYLSEGSVRYNPKNYSYIVRIAQKSYSKGFDSIEKCIQKMGHNYYKNDEDGFSISSKQLYTYLKDFGHSQQKYVPEYIKELSPRQIKIFFDAYVLGDGVIYKNKTDSDTKGVISSSKRMIDDMQELLLKMGHCGDYKIHAKKGQKANFKFENREITVQQDIYRIFKNEKYKNPLYCQKYSKVTKEEYDDYVYCCEVQNHIIYVRRNGVACWSGNSRGCVRNCQFCFVPKKEGAFKQASSIEDIINPKSNIIILHDNNLTADPQCIDKLHEIRDRKLIVDINQGCDVRLMNEDIAMAMSEVRHLRSVHYAWDLMGFENQVIDGIKLLSKYIKPYRHMCFMLVGFDTTFEEDMYRFVKLLELKVDPYVMIYNQLDDKRLKHFARWVNARIYKRCTWDEYIPWIKSKDLYNQISLI